MDPGSTVIAATTRSFNTIKLDEIDEIDMIDIIKLFVKGELANKARLEKMCMLPLHGRLECNNS